MLDKFIQKTDLGSLTTTPSPPNRKDSEAGPKGPTYGNFGPKPL